MKPSLRILSLLSALLWLPALSVPAAEADGAAARIEVILVEAGNPPAGAKGGIDPSLRPYAGTLERLFRFGAYRQLSSRSVRLDVPGEGSVALAEGQELALKATAGKGPGLMVDLEWSRGATRLLHTRLQLRPGNPAVLGGPKSGRDGGNYLLILRME